MNNNNKLSLEAKFSYKKGVALFQLIRDFENNFITYGEFEVKAKEIENTYQYSKAEENKGILTDLK